MAHSTLETLFFCTDKEKTFYVFWLINYYFQGPETPPLVSPRGGKGFSLRAAGAKDFFCLFREKFGPNDTPDRSFFFVQIFFSCLCKKKVSRMQDFDLPGGLRRRTGAPWGLYQALGGHLQQRTDCPEQPGPAVQGSASQRTVKRPVRRVHAGARNYRRVRARPCPVCSATARKSEARTMNRPGGSSKHRRSL